MLILQRPWTEQPQEAADINPVFIPGLQIVADGGTSAPTWQRFVTVDPSGFRLLGTRTVGRSGFGWLSNASTYPTARTTASNPSQIFEIPANSDWTMQFCVDAVTPLSGSNPGFFRSGSATTGTTFLLNDSGLNAPRVRINSADVLRGNLGPFWVTGQSLNLLVRSRNASRVEVWWDGMMKHAATHSTAQEALTGTSGIYGLMRHNTTEITGGSLNAFRAWTRYLGDAEMKALSDNQWALYAPGHVYLPTPTAASGLPTLSAATYVPGSLTASGFRPRVTATY